MYSTGFNEFFLTPKELVQLTGRKTKSRQIIALRSMGIPHYVNDIGIPVVSKVAISGGTTKANPPPKPKWTSGVFAGAV